MLTVVDEMGRLIDPVKEILDIIAAHDAVLCGGHLHISEMYPLFEEADKRAWTTLPARIDVGRIWVKAGTHTVLLELDTPENTMVLDYFRGVGALPVPTTTIPG